MTKAKVAFSYMGLILKRNFCFDVNGWNNVKGHPVCVSLLAECGGVLPANGGVIRAPMANFNYTHRTLCHWTYNNPDSGSTAVFKAPKVTDAFYRTDVQSYRFPRLQ